ncbi:MAG TPA: hypothetical protein VJL29_14685 [Thermoguttaceae bacterium]|nr:hypothetical protein [Thermoguttaceae bacterium]
MGGNNLNTAQTALRRWRGMTWLCFLFLCPVFGCNASTLDEGEPLTEARNSDQASPVTTRPAVDQANPSAIVAKAIRSHGGEARIQRVRKGRISQKFYSKFQPTTTWVDVFELPDKFRRDIYTEVNGVKRHMRFMSMGKEAWNIEDDGSVKRSPVALHVLRPDRLFPLSFLKQLLELKDAKGVLVAPGSRNGQDHLVAIEVPGKSAGLHSRFFFDIKTGYLVQVEHDCGSLQGPEIHIETEVYSDFRSVDGIAIPHRIIGLFEGKETTKVVLQKFKVLKVLPEDTFAKPTGAQ